MKNVKYKDYRIGKYLFTVRFQRWCIFGETAIDVEVYEQHTPHTGFIHHLIDFFKYKRYWHGTWLADNGEPLEYYAIRQCESVVYAMEDEKNAKKFWDNLDK